MYSLCSSPKLQWMWKVEYNSSNPIPFHHRPKSVLFDVYRQGLFYMFHTIFCSKWMCAISYTNLLFQCSCCGTGSAAANMQSCTSSLEQKKMKTYFRHFYYSLFETAETCRTSCICKICFYKSSLSCMCSSGNWLISLLIGKFMVCCVSGSPKLLSVWRNWLFPIHTIICFTKSMLRYVL